MAESTKDVDRPIPSGSAQKKVPIENLSREELTKKCKSLLIISQKAKQAKDEATEELKTLKQELNIRCQETEKHKLCSEKLAIQLRKVAEEKENVLLAVESIKLNNGELQNIVRNISTERDALFEEVNHLNLEKQKLLKVIASTGEENDSTVEENQTLKAEKRKLNDELFASVSLQDDINLTLKDLKVKLNNLLHESTSIVHFLDIEESSVTSNETIEDTDDVENVSKLVCKFSENFQTIASHLKSEKLTDTRAALQARLTKESGDGLESGTNSGTVMAKLDEEVETLRHVLEEVQSKSIAFDNENRLLKEQINCLQSEHEKCQLLSKDAETNQIELRNEIDSLRQASAKKTSEVALLQDEISLLMERNKEQVVNLMEMKGLRNEIQRLHNLVIDKETEIKSFREEAANFEINSQQYSSERQDFNNKVKDLQNALDNRALEMTNLKQKIQIAEEAQLKYPFEIEALGKEITNFKALIEEKEVERKKIDEQVLQFSTEIQSLKSVLSICRTELEAKNQEMFVVKQENAQTEEKYSHSNLETDRLHKEIERLKTLLDDRRKEVETVRSDVAEIENSNANYRSEVEQLKCELSNVQKEQKETECESDNFEKTLSMCTLENTTLKCEVKRLEDHLQEKDETMFSLAQEREMLEQDNVRSCSALEALERNVTILKQKLNDKDQEIARLVHESKDIEENNLKYVSELDALRSEIFALQKVLEEGDGKVSAIKKERNDIEKNKVKLASENDQLKNEVKGLKNTVLEKERNIDKVEENICKYILEIETLKNEVINLQKNLEESKHKMASITQEREEIIENNILSHSSGIEALQKEISNVQASLAKKEMEITNLRTSLTEHEVEMSNVKVNLAEKELEMSNAQENLVVKELKISNLQASLSEQELQISNLQASLAEKELEISNVQATLAEKQNEIQTLQTGVTGKGVEMSNVQTRLMEKELLISNLQTNFAEKEQEISNLKGKLAEMEQDILNVKESLAEKVVEISNVQASLAEKQSEIKTLQTGATASEVGISDIMTSLSKKEENISNLQGLLAERELQISNLVANLEEKKLERTRLEASLTDREAELSTVSNEKETLEDRHTKCSSEVEALRKQVSGLKNQLELKGMQTAEATAEAELRFSAELCALSERNTELGDLLEVRERELKHVEETLRNVGGCAESLSQAQRLNEDRASEIEFLQSERNQLLATVNKMRQEFTDELKMADERYSSKQENLVDELVNVRNSSAETEATLSRVSSELEAMKAVETEAAAVKRENAELLGEMNEMNQVLKKRGETVSKLDKTNNELERKLKDTKTSLAAALLDLQAKISECERKAEECERKAEECERKTEECGRLSSEVGTLSEQARLQEAYNRELSEEVGRLRGRMQQLEREVKEGAGCDVTSEALSCGSAPVELAGRLRDLEDSFEDRYTKLRSVAVRLKRRGSELTARIEGLEAERTGLLTRLATATARAKTVGTVQAECDRLQDELEAKGRQAREAETVLGAAQAEAAAARLALEGAEAARVRLEGELEANQAARVAAETQVKELKTEMVNAKREKSDLDAEVRRLTDETKRCERQLREEERRHGETRAELDARRQETKKNSVLCLEMVDYERAVADLGHQLATEKARVAELGGHLETQREVAAGLNEQIAMLEGGLVAEGERAAEVNQQLTVLRCRLSEAATLSSEREADIARLRSEVESHREEAEKATLLLSGVAAEKLRVEESGRLRADALGTQIRQLQDQLCACRSRLSESTGELARVSAEYEGYKVRAHSVLQRQKARPDIADGAGSRDECVEEMAQLRLAADSARTKLDETSTRLSAAAAEVATLQRDRDRILDRCRELTDSVGELTVENRRLADTGREAAARHADASAKEKLHADTLARCYKAQLAEAEERLGAELADLRVRLEVAERRAGDPGTFTPIAPPHTEPAMPEREEGEGSESVDSTSPHGSTRGRHELMPLDKLLETHSDDEAVRVTSVSPTAELAKTRDHLNMSERQVRHLSALLADAEQDLARLNQLNDVLKEEIRRNQRSEEREQHAHNQEYLKNVIFKFVTLQGGDERSRLVPVLNTLLKLSPDETKQLISVARGGVEAGGGRGWGNYLHLWPSTQ